MADSTTKEKDESEKQASGGRKTLSLGGTLSLKGGPSSAPKSGEGSSGKTVTVEVRRKRSSTNAQTKAAKEAESAAERTLTDEEREARARALKLASERNTDKKETVGQSSLKIKKQEPAQPKEKPAQQGSDSSTDKADAEKQRLADLSAQQAQAADPSKKSTGRKTAGYTTKTDKEEETPAKRKIAAPVKKRGEPRRRGSGNMTVNQAMNYDDGGFDRMPSLAAQRRAREKERMKAKQTIEHTKQVRDVIVPEAITVQELSNRMAERTGDVVKKLMEMGVMATATQTIDADTAELIVQEFGHKIKRVSAADVEEGLLGEDDQDTDLQPRPPVVTIMGHVDHGKTSLLDSLRQTDVVAGEAGGITQHIGAYQITVGDDQKKVTFLDTPGHAAFTEMRARGTDVTDIVILVVAANDSVMPQTIEAINHAKAAEKPMIIAINKCDLEEANPDKIKTDLLQHEIIVESLSGDVQCVEVSAQTKQGLDTLVDAILLQSEMLELKANPERSAIGYVVEAKMEQGRGAVATVLIQKGTLNIGDILICGAETGRVRALIDDKGQQIKHAIPGQPVEVLGLGAVPMAGDDFIVVKSDGKAREIAEYRTKKKKDLEAAKLNRGGSVEQFLAQIKEGEIKDLPVIIKADVHGSTEAIIGSLHKLTEDNDEVRVQVLHSGVGGITESDITLANASEALIIGFNVRANAQARELAKQEGVDIRYYSVIYNAIDDVKALLSGLLSPEVSEEFIGYAEILEVFNITKVGKVAGCKITSGVVKRGAKVRLLRDDVVIHEGTLKTLQRFKDEVKDVKEGYECGMAFENYDDIKQGDMIECFEIIETAREI